MIKDMKTPIKKPMKVPKRTIKNLLGDDFLSGAIGESSIL